MKVFIGNWELFNPEVGSPLITILIPIALLSYSSNICQEVFTAAEMKGTSKRLRAMRKGDKSMKKSNMIDDMESSTPRALFTTPYQKVPGIRFRDMDKWCEKHGRNPESLTKEELEQFKVQ